MIGRLRVSRLLAGVRGAPPADRGAVIRAITGLSALAADLGDQLEALDVNPLICGPAGAVAVDALAIPRSPPLTRPAGRPDGRWPGGFRAPALTRCPTGRLFGCRVPGTGKRSRLIGHTRHGSPSAVGGSANYLLADVSQTRLGAP